MSHKHSAALLASCILLSACDAAPPADGGQLDAALPDARSDAGAPLDTLVPVDAAETADAGVPTPSFEDPCAEWASVFPEDAFVVMPEQRGELQALLDAHGTIRLIPGGDYRTGGPATVRLGDAQAILSLGRSVFPDVLVAAGTEGAKVRGLSNARIRFEPGAVTRGNCFASLRGSGITSEGASVERNWFVDFGQTPVDVDNAAGGFFRDNRFIKINTHDSDLAVSLVGNADRSSGGNVFLLTDTQTPGGAPFLVEGQSDVTFVGVNAEAFNWRGLASEPYLFRVRNVGAFRGAYFVGTSRHGAAVFPMLDMDAEHITLHRTGSDLAAPQVRLGASVESFVSWENDWDDADIDDRAAGGLRLRILETQDAPAVRLNGAVLTSPPADTTAMSAALLDERPGAPWALPAFAAIPDPTGPDWETRRVGMRDERAVIQAMLDAPSGLAMLEPRTYYIGGSLVLGSGDRLIGSGMGRTAIVALDASISLLRVEWGDPSGCGAITAGFMLAELTLQGGASGIESSFPGMQINQAVLSHVTFRNMSEAGIFIRGTYGWDNNFFDHLNFVDCAFGVHQQGIPRPATSCYGIGEWSTMSYVDKTVFYRNQFVRCGRAVVLSPTRANNLDAFVESRFVDGGTAIELNSGNSGTMIASCVFENNSESPVVRGPAPLVNCHFVADRGTAMVGPHADMEGCTFRLGTSSSATIFQNLIPGDVRFTTYVNIAHSDSDMPIGLVEETVPIGGLYLNNTMPAGESMRAWMTVLDYRAQGTPNALDDTRTIDTILLGTASPGSRLLFSRAASRP